MRTNVAVLSVMATVAAVCAAEEITVKPTQIVETRIRDLGPEKDESDRFMSFGPVSGLKVTLRVEGGEAAKAYQYGKLVIAEAVDDVATDLKPEKKRRGFFSRSDDDDDDFQRVDDGGTSWFDDDEEDEEKPKGFDIELDLRLPARKAERIARLKGEFQMQVIGEETTLTLTKINDLVGKPVTDPALEKAGLRLSMPDPKKKEDDGFGFGGDGPQVSLEFKGTLDAIKEVRIVNADGERVSAGSMISTGFDVQNHTYDLRQDLDDTVRVEIDLILDLKLMKVPFSIEGVELP